MILFAKALFLRQLTRCPAATFGIGRCQPDADAALINLEPQTALFVILGELAQLRVFFDIREKTFL